MRKVDIVEIFFAGYPKMVGLNLFPHLKTLTIINQATLQKLEGLMSCPHLTELWVCETDIKVSLDKCAILYRGIAVNIVSTVFSKHVIGQKYCCMQNDAFECTEKKTHCVG